LAALQNEVLGAGQTTKAIGIGEVLVVK